MDDKFSRSRTRTGSAVDPILLEGWLKKKSPKGIPLFHGWQKRWFEFEWPHKINYYKDPTKTKLCGIIPVMLIAQYFWNEDRISIVMEGESQAANKKEQFIEKRKFNLQQAGKKRTNETQAEIAKWVDLLDKACDALDEEEEREMKAKEKSTEPMTLTDEQKKEKYWKPEQRKQLRLSVMDPTVGKEVIKAAGRKAKKSVYVGDRKPSKVDLRVCDSGAEVTCNLIVVGDANQEF